MELLIPIGRLLFSLIFIQNGIGHFRQRTGITEYARSAGAPFPEIMVPVTGLMILLGGLSVLLGVYARVGAWLLVLFLIPTARSSCTASGACRIHRRRRISEPTFGRTSRWLGARSSSPTLGRARTASYPRAMRGGGGAGQPSPALAG